MQEKINYLKERIDNISSIIGQEEIDPRFKSSNEKSISDVIADLKTQISENSNVSSDTLKKIKDISPLLEIDEYKNENIPSDRQMYNTLICNYDKIKYFLTGVKFLKNNQKFLEINPLSNREEKAKMLHENEKKTIDLETKMAKMTENIDNLLQNYNETVDIINKKFALYNQLLDNKK